MPTAVAWHSSWPATQKTPRDERAGSGGLYLRSPAFGGLYLTPYAVLSRWICSPLTQVPARKSVQGAADLTYGRPQLIVLLPWPATPRPRAFSVRARRPILSVVCCRMAVTMTDDLKDPARVPAGCVGPYLWPSASLEASVVCFYSTSKLAGT